jgi:CRISPR-associated protein Csd1
MICQSPAVQEAISRQASAEGSTVHCLISGTEDVIERLHPAIKGVWGAQTSGANIVSFNLDAFNSWGKTKGANAPVGKKAAFAYTTALNHLLAKDSRQRIQIGDASTVFWAEKPGHPMESQFGDLFSEPPKDDPDRNTEAVKSLYRSPETGTSMFDNDGTRFYVLGLAPNAARIAVRFWHMASISDLAAQFRQHFEDIAIAHAPHEPETLSLFRLAVSMAAQGKSENIPPNLMGDTMKSILTGLPYPQTLLQAAIRRSRAEQAVVYPRAALIKACINRLSRKTNPANQEELKVSLDLSNTNTGYRLGRLFAALEKIQEDANPGINATIRDRFYGAASSTPVAVFTTLLRLKNHHISKLKGEKPGLAVKREKLIGEIIEEGLDGKLGFPATLSLADQGRFAIGYYHQRQAFFTKTDQSEDEGI